MNEIVYYCGVFFIAVMLLWALSVCLSGLWKGLELDGFSRSDNKYQKQRDVFNSKYKNNFSEIKPLIIGEKNYYARGYTFFNDQGKNEKQNFIINRLDDGSIQFNFGLWGFHSVTEETNEVYEIELVGKDEFKEININER